MWSDLKDNHNKYYILQALKSTSGSYCLWTRFGRVGAAGVGNKAQLADEDAVIKEFLKTERAKNKKGYNEIKMSLGTSKNPEADADDTKKGPVEPCKLDANLQ